MAQGALVEVASLLFRWPSSSPCLDIESIGINAGERVFLFGPHFGACVHAPAA